MGAGSCSVGAGSWMLGAGSWRLAEDGNWGRAEGPKLFVLNLCLRPMWTFLVFCELKTRSQ